MSRKIVKISNEKLAQMIHMQLLTDGIHQADEIYQKILNREGNIVLKETEGIEFGEEDVE